MQSLSHDGWALQNISAGEVAACGSAKVSASADPPPAGTGEGRGSGGEGGRSSTCDGGRYRQAVFGWQAGVLLRIIAAEFMVLARLS